MHLFAIVRTKVTNVPAPSMPEAIPVALERIPAPSLDQRFNGPDTEFAEECSHFLVDVAGDEEFEQSQFFHSAQDPLLAFVRDFVAWQTHDREEDRLRTLLAQAAEILTQTA